MRVDSLRGRSVVVAGAGLAGLTAARDLEKQGARVTVVGPLVWDTAHDWPEIHPAWWISSGRIVPASNRELTRVESLLRDGQSEQEGS